MATLMSPTVTPVNEPTYAIEFLKNGIQLQPGTFGEYPHVNPKEETYGK